MTDIMDITSMVSNCDDHESSMFLEVMLKFLEVMVMLLEVIQKVVTWSCYNSAKLNKGKKTILSSGYRSDQLGTLSSIASNIFVNIVAPLLFILQDDLCADHRLSVMIICVLHASCQYRASRPSKLSATNRTPPSLSKLQVLQRLLCCESWC